MFKGVITAAAAALLTACGGGGSDSIQQSSATAEPVQTTEVAVRGCDEARLHDAGFVAYVTVEPECTPAQPITVGFLDDVGEVHRVGFSDMALEQDVDLPDWDRRVAVVKRGSWRQFPNEGSWTWRDGAGLLAKDGGLYLLGGWNSEIGTTSDVWFTRDVQNWTRLTAQGPWTGRHGAGWLVHDDRLYVIGGDFLSDVWSSPDGVHWTEHTEDAGFGPRYAPNAASLNGELLFYNGQSPAGVGVQDLHASSDGGATWQQAAATPYAGRALIHGAAVSRGRVYVIGGGLKGYVPTSTWSADTTAEFTDIWSSADGRAWVQESGALGFAPRTHFAVLGTERGCYVANGSITVQANQTSEVLFAEDCVHFTLLPTQPPMKGVHATSLAEFNGSIVLLGGHGSAVGSSVWQYFTDL